MLRYQCDNIILFNRYAFNAMCDNRYVEIHEISIGHLINNCGIQQFLMKLCETQYYG